MSYLYRKPLRPGYNPIITSKNPDIKLIEFGVLNLKAGESYAIPAEKKECCGIILNGRCTVAGDGFSWENVGGRRSVFDGKATSFYLPTKVGAKVTATEGVSLGIAKSPSDLESEPTLITPDMVGIRNVGRHNWRRVCHDIIPGPFKAKHLVLGETFNPPGNWSSVPPHCHEKDNLPIESLQEEVYYFKLSPSQGFGLQRMYTDDRSLDECYTIEDNDTVALPRGYHPVAAAPGYRLYYLWILAGPRRAMVPRDDPAHAWLKNCEPIVDEIV